MGAPLALIAGVVVGTLVSGGAASAYWSNNSTGSGDGRVAVADGNSRPIVIVQTSRMNPLEPGKSVMVAGTFDNPNNGYDGGRVLVRTVTVTIVGVRGHGRCSPADFTVTRSPMQVNAVIPGGRGVGRWGGAVVTMVNASHRDQGGCHGATVQLHYTSN